MRYFCMYSHPLEYSIVLGGCDRNSVSQGLPLATSHAPEAMPWSRSAGVVRCSTSSSPHANATAGRRARGRRRQALQHEGTVVETAERLVRAELEARAADPDAGVLLHCHMGINRGPSAAYAVLLSLGWDPIAAIAVIRAKRPIAAVGYAEDALDWWHRRTDASPAHRRADVERLARWRLANITRRCGSFVGSAPRRPTN